MLEAKNAKQRRLIAAILRERRKFSRKRASQAQRFPYHAAGEFSLSMADQLTVQSLRHFDVPAHFMFAYRRTGLLVTVENEASMSACDLRRWNKAMLEYFQIEGAKKAGSASGMFH